MRIHSILLPTICLALALLPACDDAPKETTDPCETVTCEVWEACEAGICLPQEGRCTNYTHCADDLFCDDDLHVCRGPVHPDDAFLDDLEGDSVAFEFAGLINPDTAANPTLGEGAYTFDVGALSGTVGEYAYAIAFTFPEDYADTSLAGARTVVLGASRIHTQAGDEINYHHFNWIVRADVLQAAVTADDPVLEAPELVRFHLMDVNQFVRPWDQRLFRRYCTLSAADARSTEGRLFVSFFQNAGFFAGEELTLWGNLPMTPQVVITPENEEDHCSYRVGETYVTKAEYEAGRAATEPTLTCGLPEDFFDPPAAAHLGYLFSGLINPGTATLQTVVHGYGDATVMIPEEVTVDDYNSLAMHVTSGTPEPVLYVQSLGGVEYLSDTHYTFHMLALSVHVSTLAGMKADQLDVIPWDADHMFAALEAHEERVVGEDTYSRVCPLALTAPDAAGELLVCTGGNTAFAAEEALELAASVGLATDAASIATAYGYADGQTCHCRFNYGNIDCALFEALEDGR